MLIHVNNFIKHKVINGSLNNLFLHFDLFIYKSNNMNVTSSPSKWSSDSIQ